MTHPAIRNRARIVALANKLLPALPELLNAIHDTQSTDTGTDYGAVTVAGTTTILDDDGHPLPPRSDPTGRAATEGNPQAAKAREHERNVIALTHQLLAQLDQLQIIHQTYIHRTLDIATARQMTQPHDPQGCRSCARITRGKAQRRTWAPVYRTSTVANNLPEPMPLCRWCYDWVLRHGQIPPRKKLLAHLDGKTVYDHDVAS